MEAGKAPGRIDATINPANHDVPARCARIRR